MSNDSTLDLVAENVTQLNQTFTLNVTMDTQNTAHAHYQEYPHAASMKLLFGIVLALALINLILGTIYTLIRQHEAIQKSASDRKKRKFKPSLTLTKASQRRPNHHQHRHSVLPMRSGNKMTIFAHSHRAFRHSEV